MIQLDEQKRWDRDKIVDYIVWIAGFSIGLIIVTFNYLNLLGLAGLGLFVWGIYELFKNKTVKSLVGKVAITFSGIIMMLFWFIFNG